MIRVDGPTHYSKACCDSSLKDVFVVRVMARDIVCCFPVASLMRPSVPRFVPI